MILQQSNIFGSGYIGPPPMPALPYLMQVTVILLSSLHACLLQVQNVYITLRSYDLGHNPYILGLVCEDCKFFGGVTSAR